MATKDEDKKKKKAKKADELKKEETFPSNGGADVKEPKLPKTGKDNSSESYGEAQGANYIAEKSAKQRGEATENASNASQNAGNVVDNGANEASLGNGTVNNFAGDKSVNGGKNMTPGYVIPGANGVPDYTYQGANADGTLNVSLTDSPAMVRRQMDKDGNLQPVRVDNSELYAEVINDESKRSSANAGTSVDMDGGTPGASVPGEKDPRNGIVGEEGTNAKLGGIAGEGAKENASNDGEGAEVNAEGAGTAEEQGDNNKAEAIARANGVTGQSGNAGLTALRQGLSTEGGMTLDTDPNGKMYVSTDPRIRALQNIGALDPDELVRKRLEEVYLAGAPEAVSKEEEDRIIRGRETAKGIAAFGNLLGALANVWGTSKGAVSQQIPSLPSFDYEALRDKYRQGRNALAKYKAGVSDYINGQIAKRQKLELDRQKAEVDAQYKQARTDYYAAQQALKEAELAFRNGHDGMSQAELQRYNKALSDMALANRRLKMMQDRYNQMIALGWYNATTQRMRADKYVAGGGTNGNDRIYTPEGTYQIKPSVWAANIGALANATGVSITKEVDWKNPLTGLPERKVVNKSANELKQEIIANWNEDCTFIAESLGALVADAQQPATQTPAAPSATSTPQPAATATSAGTDSTKVANAGSNATPSSTTQKAGTGANGTKQEEKQAEENQGGQEGKSVIKHSSHLKHRGEGDGSEKGTSSAGKDDANLTAEQKEEKEAEARRARSGRKTTIGK